MMTLNIKQKIHVSLSQNIYYKVTRNLLRGVCGSVYTGLHEFNLVYRTPLTFLKNMSQDFPHSPDQRIPLQHVIFFRKCSKTGNFKRLQKVGLYKKVNKIRKSCRDGAALLPPPITLRLPPAHQPRYRYDSDF